MRIWKLLFTMTLSLPAFLPSGLEAQPVNRPARGISIILTNGALVGTTPANAMQPQDIAPNLAMSNATPAIGRPGITPAMPTPGAPARGQPGVANGTAIQPFTPALGQQGFGGALGQQGSGTAIGQQGSGTAIGQQGVGTAIIPETNATVIGQPTPFSPNPALTPSVGFSSNLPTGFGRGTMPFPGTGLTGGPPAMVHPPAGQPLNRSGTTGRR